MSLTSWDESEATGQLCGSELNRLWGMSEAGETRVEVQSPPGVVVVVVVATGLVVGVVSAFVGDVFVAPALPLWVRLELLPRALFSRRALVSSPLPITVSL